MKKYLHVLLGLLFVVVLLWELIVWGAVSSLPVVGPSIRSSLGREAPLVMTYVKLGEILDQLVPVLHSVGTDTAERALSPGFERIKQDPAVATNLMFSNTWNGTHRFLKLGVWGVPVLLVLFLIAWVRRPRQVRTLGR